MENITAIYIRDNMHIINWLGVNNIPYKEWVSDEEVEYRVDLWELNEKQIQLLINRINTDIVNYNYVIFWF